MFKMDVSRMKKISADNHSTTLQHPDGHTMKIAHGPLSPKIREQLKAIPLADGGEVPEAQQAPTADAQPQQAAQPAQEPQYNPEDYIQVPKDVLAKHIANLQALDKPVEQPALDPIDFIPGPGEVAGIAKAAAVPFAIAAKAGAEGAAKTAVGKDLLSVFRNEVANLGEKLPFHVRSMQDKALQDAGNAIANNKTATQANKLAMGVRSATDASADNAVELAHREAARRAAGKNFAGGGEIKQSNPKLEESKKQPPNFDEGGEVAEEAQIQTPQQLAPVEVSASPDLPPPPADPNAIPGAETPPVMEAPSANGPPTPVPGSSVDGMAATNPQALGAQQIPTASEIPNIGNAYEQGIASSEIQAQAEQTRAKEQAAIQDQAAKQSLGAYNKFEHSVNDLNTEFANIRKDIESHRVDPEKYWDNHSKVAAGIGILLAGFNPSGGPNQAIGFINNQIDRSMQAQVQNLNSKHNILSANLAHFRNLNDAASMTRLMMADHFSHMMDAATAKSQDPMAMARKLQIQSALQQQMAPQFYQLAARRALMNPEGVHSEDPASYVPFVVPPDKQKDVLKEIGQAQNIAKNKTFLLQQFDKAAKENTVLRTGAGVIRTPASIQAMDAMELPIIHDAEGRVNEFEQHTLQSLHPQPGDTDAKIAQKRVAYESFMNQKQSAPTAKAYNIDMSRFASTAPAVTSTPQYKMVNGVKYVRGPNGEAIKVK